MDFGLSGIVKEIPLPIRDFREKTFDYREFKEKNSFLFSQNFQGKTVNYREYSVKKLTLLQPMAQQPITPHCSQWFIMQVTVSMPLIE